MRIALLFLLAAACGDDVESNPPPVGGDAGASGDSGRRGVDAGRNDGGTTVDAATTPPPVPGAIEGYASDVTGGAGGEVCIVTTLADDGDGSLRSCILDRDPSTPRTIEFDVGGTITLQSDIVVVTPFLTIDGATAPSPGITIEKANVEDGEFIITSNGRGFAHDVVVRYLRFDGGWDGLEDHSQNSATITIDGENTPEGVHRVVLDHLVFTRASDGSPDLWGTVHDVTISWSMFLNSLHPMTISHTDGARARERISLHHNVYAYNHERNPQVRGNVSDLDYVNNVVFEWTRFGGGYGLRLRERSGLVPTRVNLVNNFFSSTMNPGTAIMLEPTDYPGDVYASGNVLPAASDADVATVSSPIDVPAANQVTTYSVDELDTSMLPSVGLPVRTDEEVAVLAAVAEAMEGSR